MICCCLEYSNEMEEREGYFNLRWIVSMLVWFSVLEWIIFLIWKLPSLFQNVCIFYSCGMFSLNFLHISYCMWIFICWQELFSGTCWSKVFPWTICLFLFWFSSTLRCPLCTRYGLFTLSSLRSPTWFISENKLDGNVYSSIYLKDRIVKGF